MLRALRASAAVGQLEGRDRVRESGDRVARRRQPLVALLRLRQQDDSASVTESPGDGVVAVTVAHMDGDPSIAHAEVRGGAVSPGSQGWVTTPNGGRERKPMQSATGLKA